MASNLEPVEGGSPLPAVAMGAGSLLVGFFVVRWLIGAVWGAIQFGFFVVVVLAVVYAVAKLSRGMKA